MKKGMYTRQKRQFKNYLHQLQLLLKSGKWNLLSPEKKKSITLKINVLFSKIRYTFKPKEFSKALTAIAALFGFSNSSAQVFDPPVDSIFGLPTNLSLSFLTSADLDNDGDLDLVITNRNNAAETNEILYYQNIGTPTEPNFTDADNDLVPIPVLSPYSYVYLRVSRLADIDGDGDYDLLVSEYGYDEVTYEYHKWLFFENIGTPESPSFAEATENPFAFPNDGYLFFPDFGDVDGDGDLDVFMQRLPYEDPEILFFENTGSATNPTFGTPVINPFGLVPTDIVSISQLGDLDNDGDLDLLTTGYYGDFNFFQNSGSIGAPLFEAPVQNSLGLVSAGGPQFPEVLDIDSDGDLDIISAAYDGYDNSILNFHKNNLITGLEEINEIDLSVFPNPSSDYLEIVNSSDIQFNRIQLISITGKRVYDSSFNSNILSLDMRNYEAGSYILLLSNSEQVYQKTIIKN